MEFETAVQAAERMGVTVRAVQKWAKQGQLPGAKKQGRDWMIPADCIRPGSAGLLAGADSHAATMPRSLLNEAFPLGECRTYIDSIANEDERNLVLAEYYYYSGDAEKAARLAEPYLNSQDPYFGFLSAMLCVFADLSRGHLHLARFAMDRITERLTEDFGSDTASEAYAVGVLAATTVVVLLQLPSAQLPPLERHLRVLPGGLKMFALYLLAQKAYLEKDYSRACGIAETALVCVPEPFPIASVYTHLITAVSLINLMKVEQAKRHLEQAWELAKPDGLIEIFGQHYGLLQGIIEVFFKKDHPEEFARIIAAAKAFGKGWIAMHNHLANQSVASNLTITEFTIAMLYSRGWRVKEIAAHMDLSERTVKNHLQIVYEKLGINGKKGLEQFLLK